MKEVSPCTYPKLTRVSLEVPHSSMKPRTESESGPAWLLWVDPEPSASISSSSRAAGQWLQLQTGSRTGRCTPAKVKSLLSINLEYLQLLLYVNYECGS